MPKGKKAFASKNGTQIMKLKQGAAEVLKSGPKTVSQQLVRRFPIGAEVRPEGTDFRVWAPQSKRVVVELSHESIFPNGQTRTIALCSDKEGYFSGFIKNTGAGLFYRYELDAGSFPDPASRFQPEGPHGPSQLVDPTKFQWTDLKWQGVSYERQIIYEMHVGTFTSEGTWRAAETQLQELARLGITTIEMMPVGDFPGRFGWGYDGVNLFAPTRLYGTPDDLRSFINRAHTLGLGVILDVVYNHLGPDGNYLGQFSKNYFTDRYSNEWGGAINYDGEQSGPVREFFLANAGYWVEEFHFDGLRLDATQQIFDASPKHILTALSERVRQAGGERSVYLVAENEPQQVKLLQPSHEGGHALDALWNDDFHHAAHVAATGERQAYYSPYKGVPQEFISCMKRGFLYQGQWYPWQKKSRGTPTFGIEPARFINFLQNHDQIANSLCGRRIHQSTSPGRLRALTALLLLGSGTPMLFQGQEFAASTPFVYLADHAPELADQVAKGRREFLSQFDSMSDSEATNHLPDLSCLETFNQCKLHFSEREAHEEIYRLHRDLIQLRQTDPVFSTPRIHGLDGAVLAPEAFVLRFFGADGLDRLLIVNLGSDLELCPPAEPLLAPPPRHSWSLAWSSESPFYGGKGTPPLKIKDHWLLIGQAATVLFPASQKPMNNDS